MEDGVKVPLSREMEDALMYLSRKPLVTHRKGQIIFDERHPPCRHAIWLWMVG